MARQMKFSSPYNRDAFVELRVAVVSSLIDRVVVTQTACIRHVADQSAPSKSKGSFVRTADIEHSSKPKIINVCFPVRKSTFQISPESQQWAYSVEKLFD